MYATKSPNLLVPISDEEPSSSYLKLDRSAYRNEKRYNSAQSSFRQLVETPDASSDPAIVDANTENWAELKFQKKLAERNLKTSKY